MNSNDKPWEHEPDHLLFMSEAGYICEIKRHEWGHLCGYIFIPFGHPDYGKTNLGLGGAAPDVHGGWTYSDTRGDGDDEDGGEYTVFGFDCNHSGDYAPGGMVYQDVNPPSNYKTIEFVVNQLEQAAKQFKERETP